MTLPTEELCRLLDDPAARALVPARELTETLLARIEEQQPHLHALITVTPDLALAAARDVDAARARGRRLPLDGLPLVLKDNIDVEGVPTTNGSRLFAGRLAAEDAAVTRRLRVAGAVVLGKANLHELAFGATSANEAFGSVLNPAAPDRVPGGSSGGSAAAVAADLCAAAIGTDTGGSIRLPASLCGVTGLRPSHGSVSLQGVRPVSATLDTVGPLARSAKTVRAVQRVIAGHDTGDAYPEANAPASGADTCLRLGVVGELHERSAPGVRTALEALQELLAGLGAELRDVALQGWERAVEACGLLIKAEALALYDRALEETPYLLEKGTRRRLELARHVDAGQLRELRAEHEAWTRTVAAAFAGVDLILLPTIPLEAPAASSADTVETTAGIVPFTHLLSFARVPSLSLPCGWSAGGAPVGAMVAAPAGHDGRVLDLAEAVQAVSDWHLRRPETGGAQAGSMRTTS
ncbi:MAG: amidase [Gaiella sp.]